MVLSLAATIVLFAAALNLGPRVTRALIGLSSVALACFGCVLLWSGVRGLQSPVTPAQRPRHPAPHAGSPLPVRST